MVSKRMKTRGTCVQTFEYLACVFSSVHIARLPHQQLERGDRAAEEPSLLPFSPIALESPACCLFLDVGALQLFLLLRNCSQGGLFAL